MNRFSFLIASPLFLLACSSASLTASPSDASTPTDSASPAPAAPDAGDAQAAPESDDAGSVDASPPVDASAPTDALPIDADTVDSAPTFVTTNDAGIFSFEVVSPNVCTEKAGYLLDCTFHPLAIVPFTTTAAPPVQSVLTFQESGNCSTQFDVVFQLNANGATVVNFHLSDKTATVRRTDSAAITSLVVTETSSLVHHYAAYDDTCRLSVEVQMNEPASP